MKHATKGFLQELALYLSGRRLNIPFAKYDPFQKYCFNQRLAHNRVKVRMKGLGYCFSLVVLGFLFMPQQVIAQADDNLAVDKLISPESQCQFWDDQAVTVQYQSKGTEMLSRGTRFSVRYTFKGNTVRETHTLQNDLTKNETFTHTFSRKIRVGNISQDQQWYNIKATIDWSKDQRASDDTLRTAFKNSYSAPVPDSVIGDTICRKEKATFKIHNPRKKSKTRYEWFSQKNNGVLIGKGAVTQTPKLYGKVGYDTFYAKRIDSASAPLMFTEIYRNINDPAVGFSSGAEIANIAKQARDYTGWTVTMWKSQDGFLNLNLRYPADYNKMNWDLGRFDAREIKVGIGGIEFDDNVWPANFKFLGSPDPFAAVIVRPDGSVADFVATSASASMIKNMAVEVNGDTITYADVKWSGPSPNNYWGSSPNWSNAKNWQRVGGKDHNNASDWKDNNPSRGKVNPNLNFRAFTTGTCPSKPKPVAVDIRPNPKPAFPVNKPVCATDTIKLADTSGFQGQTSLKYEWQVDSQRYRKDTLRYAFPQSSGQYPVDLKATSGLGCQDSITKTLTVHADPVARMDTVVSCARSPFQLEDQSTFPDNGLLSKKWQVAGKAFKAWSPTVQLSKPDTYNVDLTVTSQTGCSDQTTGTAIIKRSPQTSFTVHDTCKKQPVNLVNTTKFSGSVQNLDYQWSMGSDKSFSKANPTPRFANAGEYWFRLTTTAPNGCSDSASKQVAIHPKPDPDFEAYNTCNKNQIKFDVNPGYKRPTDKLSFNWNLGDNSQKAGSPLTHTYPDTASYSVALNVRDTITGCHNSVTKMVNVKPQPVADFSADPVCEGETTRFSYEGDYPAESYQYTFGDGAISAKPNPSHTFSQAGSYPVTFEVTFKNQQCQQSVTDTVTVYPVPKAKFQFDTGAICARDTLAIKNTTKFKGDRARLTYDWAFGNQGHRQQEEPAFAFSEAGTHLVQLTATSPKGCTDQYTRTKVIKPLPNADFIIEPVASHTLKFKAENRSYPTYNWTIQYSKLTGPDYNKPVIQFKVDSPVQNLFFHLMVENRKGCTNDKQIAYTTWPTDFQDQGSDQRKNFTAYPNPFSEQLNVNYKVAEQADVRIGIYSTSGHRLFYQSFQNRPAGAYKLSLNATDQLPEGQNFLLRVQIGDKVYSKKLIHLNP